jgi:hypothetical protein
VLGGAVEGEEEGGVRDNVGEVGFWRDRLLLLAQTGDGSLDEKPLRVSRANSSM